MSVSFGSTYVIPLGQQGKGGNKQISANQKKQLCSYAEKLHKKFPRSVNVHVPSSSTGRVVISTTKQLDKGKVDKKQGYMKVENFLKRPGNGINVCEKLDVHNVPGYDLVHLADTHRYKGVKYEAENI